MEFFYTVKHDNKILKYDLFVDENLRLFEVLYSTYDCIEYIMSEYSPEEMYIYFDYHGNLVDVSQKLCELDSSELNLVAHRVFNRYEFLGMLYAGIRDFKKLDDTLENSVSPEWMLQTLKLWYLEKCKYEISIHNDELEQEYINLYFELSKWQKSDFH